MLLLRVDYRQYPTYPSGYFIHMVIGFIAAATGAVSVPTVLSKNFTAITFLFLAIQQFREVRKMERDSFGELDKSQYYPRGEAYIDGIAKTFEVRNYIAMTVLFVTVFILSTPASMFKTPYKLILSLLAASVVHLMLSRFVKGKAVKDIADVNIAKISFDGSNLFVDDIYVTNIGL